MKKCISVVLAALLAFGTVAAVSATGAYDITNPYENVDFSEVIVCKTALHTHTNASDGDPTLKESIERYYATGFDMVATTDHGTVNYSWAEPCPNTLIHGALALVGKSEGELEYLGKSGRFADGTEYRLVSENGDDFVVAGDRKLMRVPYGIENNAVSVNAHVNSWFVDYSDNTVTNYEDSIKAVQRFGGLSVINHPGEYSKARYEITDADAYNTNELSYWYLVNKWAQLLEKNDTCIGVDMNSKGDNRTRFDRKIWDVLLTRFANNGENVYGICSSDAHQLDKIDTGFVLALVPEQSSGALKAALANGEFFGGSHCIGSPKELREIADALLELCGSSAVYENVKAAADALDEKADAIANGREDADEDLGITYDVLDGNGFTTCDTFPSVDGVVVDRENGTITLSVSDALIVRWISDGELVTTTKADDATFSVADNADRTGNYVRAEVFGEGGILYTQAFLINAETNRGTSRVVDPWFLNIGVFDFLFGVIANWIDIIVRAVTNLF